MNDIAGLMVAFLISFGGLLYYTYDNLEYKGYPRVQNCTGECYEEYVRTHGTAVEIEMKKQELASADEFSSIRSLWAGCAACHGQNGEGMAVFPALKGQTADYIIDRLTTYKNKGEVGAMSSTMWAQAGQLSEQDIATLGKFIEVELK
tara:strand:+ start:4420 stop:4863 length:444 start_codon:yes stop_codon:yes gene_type:complete